MAEILMQGIRPFKLEFIPAKDFLESSIVRITFDPGTDNEEIVEEKIDSPTKILGRKYNGNECIILEINHMSYFINLMKSYEISSTPERLVNK